ncbi:MAG: T9SS type A sorting domain-containing protein [Paludibacteraceae bacterium]|nr:T9SS type A sorting domain-containing protein [Paludibacteraceae bacterium]
MRNIHFRILLVFGLIVCCASAWGEGVAVKITVESSGQTQTFDMYESGKMYFADDFLIIETDANAVSRQNPVKIDLKEIKKLLFTSGEFSKIDDATYVSSFDLSPNPAKEYVIVRIPFEEECNFLVYDMKGEVKMSGKTNNGGKIDVSSLPAGVYLMNIGSMYIKFNKI